MNVASLDLNVVAGSLAGEKEVHFVTLDTQGWLLVVLDGSSYRKLRAYKEAEEAIKGMHEVGARIRSMRQHQENMIGCVDTHCRDTVGKHLWTVRLVFPDKYRLDNTLLSLLLVRTVTTANTLVPVYTSYRKGAVAVAGELIDSMLGGQVNWITMGNLDMVPEGYGNSANRQ